MHLIVLATDPASKAGGIAIALPGFLELVRGTGTSCKLVPTHAANEPGGKWKPLLRAVPAMYREICAARRRGQVPIAWMQVGGPVSSLRKALLAVLLRSIGVPVITQLHSASVQTYLKAPLRKRLFLASLAPSTLVVVLTPWWERKLRHEGLQKPLAVLPNVLSEDLERVARSSEAVIQRQNALSLRVLSMSRMVAGKGFECVIDALTSCDTSVTLTLAGDGPLRKDLEARVARLGVQDRVTFLGWVDLTRKHAALLDCDVFCLPSSYDSFGMGFIEAMVFGKPVVALANGPTVDVVPDVKCGTLVPPDNSLAVANALEALRQNIPQRQIMGLAAREWVVNSYSRQALKPQLTAIIHETLTHATAAKKNKNLLMKDSLDVD